MAFYGHHINKYVDVYSSVKQALSIGNRLYQLYRFVFSFPYVIQLDPNLNSLPFSVCVIIISLEWLLYISLLERIVGRSFEFCLI